jgi:hypothetical protein
MPRHRATSRSPSAVAQEGKPLSLSAKLSRLAVRLKDPEWRRYGRLLLTGKLMGVGLVLLAIFVVNLIPELKTYGFSCPDHLRGVLRVAEARWLAYEPVPGETLHEVGVYRCEPGRVGRELIQDRDAEGGVRS